MSRRKKTSWKLPLKQETLSHLAPCLFDEHDKWVQDGYVLTPASSGMWHKRNGTLTARLVYRRPFGASGTDERAVTVRNIPMPESVRS